MVEVAFSAGLRQSTLLPLWEKLCIYGAWHRSASRFVAA